MVETLLAPETAELSAGLDAHASDLVPDAFAALSALTEVLTSFQGPKGIPGPHISPALVASAIVTLETLPAILETLADSLGIGRD